MTSMSRTGSTVPLTWWMSASSKQRTTCTMAFTSRMWLRNWLPKPSPLLAPRTRPAMSTNSMAAGMSFCELRQLGKRLQPRIGHGDDAHVGIDGAKRVIGRLRLAGAGDGVEEGGFAHVGQSDDSGA